MECHPAQRFKAAGITFTDVVKSNHGC
jgi:hypothetical protein